MTDSADRPTTARRGGSRHRARAPLTLCLALAATFPSHANSSGDLTALSLEQLLDVSIVGASKYEQKQSEVAAAVSVITRQEIKAFGWRTLDEALASLPGIHTTYDRQYSYLGVRGFGLPGDLTARVLITIDGNRVNDPTYDGGPVGRELPVDLDLIERIEFIPGPGGAVYGQNAMFGVVNLVTRRGADVDGAELAFARQNPQRLWEGRASWGRRLGNGVDLLLSVSGMNARGQDRFYEYGTSGVAGVATGMDAERDRELFARVAGGAWAFELVHGDRRKKDPTAAFFNDPLVPTAPFKDSSTLAQLQYQNRYVDDTLQLSARLFMGRYRYDGTFSYGTLFGFPAQGDWRGTEWRVVSSAFAGHKLMVGLEAQDNVRTDQAVLDLADPANDLYIARSGYRVGLYAQDEWRLADTLVATLGLRVDRNNLTGTKASPRAALIWQAGPDTALKALYGRAHRAPNAYESEYSDRFSQVANPALHGERVDTLELVADQRVGRDLVLRASVYQWTTRDLVTLGIDPASGLSQFQSGQAVKARGMELSADKTWGNGARVRGSVSLQDAAYANGDSLLNSPKLLGKLNLSGPLPWAGLRAGYELRFDSRRQSRDGSMLGGYAPSNLHLSTEALATGLELSLGVFNLFDKRYSHPAAESNWQNALDQDGRSVRARLLYRF